MASSRNPTNHVVLSHESWRSNNISASHLPNGHQRRTLRSQRCYKVQLQTFGYSSVKNTKCVKSSKYVYTVYLCFIICIIFKIVYWCILFYIDNIMIRMFNCMTDVSSCAPAPESLSTHLYMCKLVLFKEKKKKTSWLHCIFSWPYPCSPTCPRGRIMLHQQLATPCSPWWNDMQIIIP